MRNILAFFIRNYPFFLFLGLQFFSAYLFINYNEIQKASFLNSSQAIAGNVYEKRAKIMDYLHLKEVNDELRQELQDLLNNLGTSSEGYFKKFLPYTDSIYRQQYEFIQARVINSSVHRNRNYLTLNKGLNHGIHPEMAVKSKDGLVGVVIKSSAHYAVVMPIINKRFTVAAKVEKNHYFGLVTWDGNDPRIAQLSDVPKHAPIQKGDLITTRSESGIYPTGLEIGRVDTVRTIPGGNYLEIDLTLNTDFHNIYDVMVVKNLIKEEQSQIEQSLP